jgi:hypothetical protein
VTAVIISHSRRFTFVHIHKTGGTSLERALDPHLAWYDLILGGSPFGEQLQQPYAARFKLHKHSSVAEIERICGPEYVDSYYLFAVVRHPVARACSLYNFVASTLNKWASNQGIGLNEVALHITEKASRKKPGLKWASSRAFMETQNFSDFIRHEKTSGAPGFRTQVSSLRAPSGELKGKFLRIEDHDGWTDSLAEKLGVEIHLPHANASTVRLADEQTVNDNDRRYIEALFREDYEAFGY